MTMNDMKSHVHSTRFVCAFVRYNVLFFFLLPPYSTSFYCNTLHSDRIGNGYWTRITDMESDYIRVGILATGPPGIGHGNRNVQSNSATLMWV